MKEARMNNKGLGMIEIMLIAALAGVIALTVMRLVW